MCWFYDDAFFLGLLFCLGILLRIERGVLLFDTFIDFLTTKKFPKNW